MVRSTLILTVALALGFASPAAAQQLTGSLLVQAGFLLRAADTPKKRERLATLPARRFVARKRNGRPYYIYADPGFCVCAYVGTPEAMRAYWQILADARAAANSDPEMSMTESDMLHDMERDDFEAQFNEDIFHPGF